MHLLYVSLTRDFTERKAYLTELCGLEVLELAPFVPRASFQSIKEHYYLNILFKAVLLKLFGFFTVSTRNLINLYIKKRFCIFFFTRRFIAILFPLQAKSLCTPKHAVLLCILIWCMSFILAIPILFGQVSASKCIKTRSYPVLLNYVCP